MFVDRRAVQKSGKGRGIVEDGARTLAQIQQFTGCFSLLMGVFESQGKCCHKLRQRVEQRLILGHGSQHNGLDPLESDSFEPVHNVRDFLLVSVIDGKLTIEKVLELDHELGVLGAVARELVYVRKPGATRSGLASALVHEPSNEFAHHLLILNHLIDSLRR